MFGRSGKKTNYIGIVGLNKDLVLSVATYRKIKAVAMPRGMRLHSLRTVRGLDLMTRS